MLSESSAPVSGDHISGPGARASSPRVPMLSESSAPVSGDHISGPGARAFSPRVPMLSESSAPVSGDHISGPGARAFSPRVPSCGPAVAPGRRRPPHAALDLQPYFVTARIRRSRGTLDSAARAAAVDELLTQRARDTFLLLAFAIMPDHAHVVIVPSAGYSISQTMRLVKGSIARRVNQLDASTGALWQGGFWDKSPRDLRELNQYIGYTEMNPVRAGLVREASEYPYSSADGRCLADYRRFFALEQP